MNSKVTEKKFKGFTVVTINPGKIVLCDLCNKDYTDSEEKGGFLFSGKAVCPDCAPRFMEDVKKYHEEKYIKAIANEGESFRDFVYRIR